MASTWTDARSSDVLVGDVAGNLGSGVHHARPSVDFLAGAGFYRPLSSICFRPAEKAKANIKWSCFRCIFLVVVLLDSVGAGEWNCAGPSPEAEGTFNCTSDCTMTSAGVTLTENLNITGDASLTTITA